MELLWRQVVFLLIFAGSFAACSNGLPSTFQRAENLKGTEGVYCGGALYALFKSFLAFLHVKFCLLGLPVQ